MNASIEPTPYQELGGDEPLRRLVDRFYDLMLCEPDVAEVRDMHGSDTTQIRERLFDFLSGWLGGPSRFIEKHGHPRLRFRHRFFRIGVLERDQWMFCMHKALAETPMDGDLRVRLEQAIANMADALRNDSHVAHGCGAGGCASAPEHAGQCGC
ncbi:hemoglobin-like protein [Stutzerimonas frequens]|uniref:group II truncated hemoglobin n=1 Tax=Stutzerimonas frequens TaxID=2968969 RepID=UPI0007B8309E|nr:group II truncated hemoglobin [Stutzerimonas frequens]AWT10993.1 hemoglobin-like protein [Stutzerimonas frequens]NCT79018.1 group II truncated hemoglobin [Stutzerimonas stutzeri]